MLRGFLLSETASLWFESQGLFSFSQFMFLGPPSSFSFSDVLQQGRLQHAVCCGGGCMEQSLCSRGVPWAPPQRGASCLSWDHELEPLPVTWLLVCRAVLWAITLACRAAFKARALSKLGMWHTKQAIIFILYLLTNCKSVILRMLSILASLQASLISLWKKKRCSL